MGFIDLTAAFDSINREALWKILLVYGCPLKFVTLFHVFHDDTQGVSFCNGSTMAPYKVKTDVNQGSVIVHMLFIFLAAMLYLITFYAPSKECCILLISWKPTSINS